jgi:hypothetical protein
MKNLKPIARKTELVVQHTGDETLVYDLRTDKASCLNQTSALVWENCDGEKSVGDIAIVLERATNAKVTDDLVWLAIDQLSRNSLLENKVPSTESVVGMSRRSFAKKVGLTSMVALPLVASLVAPQALHANSACIAGGACLCSEPSNGRQGEVCTATVACTDVNCNCSFQNNGNSPNGICIA